MVSRDQAFTEAPVVFGRDHSLVGSMCMPRGADRPSPPFVLFINAGIIHRTGPNRIFVKLARALAGKGFPSLRFDLSGIGDSVLPSMAEGMSIQDRVRIDIDDAFEFLRERYGADELILIGLCSGADNALRTMGRRDDVVGSILLDLNTHPTLGFYLRHYSRMLVRRHNWKQVVTGQHPTLRAVTDRILKWTRVAPSDDDSPSVPKLNLDAWVPLCLMREYLERLVARGGRLLCIFTGGLPDQYNYREQFLDLFPGLDFRDRLTLKYYADADHTYSRVDLQDRLTDVIVQWVTEVEEERSTRSEAPRPAGPGPPQTRG